MTKRIRVTDSSDPQTKVFAVTKRFNNWGVGTVKRVGQTINLYAPGAWQASDTKLDNLFEKLMSLEEVSSIAIDGDCQMSLTIGPALFWSDLNDGITALDHIVRFIIDDHFGGAEDVELVFDSPSYIDVFPGSHISKMFVCSAPIATAEGELYYWRQTGGDICSPTTKDAKAQALACAILLHRRIIWVRIAGKQVAVGAGHWAKDGEQWIQQEYPLDGDLLDYVLSTIRNNVFSDAFVPARIRPNH